MTKYGVSKKKIGGNATALFKSLLPYYGRLNSDYIKTLMNKSLICDMPSGIVNEAPTNNIITFTINTTTPRIALMALDYH